jgi:hypothetical protein
VKIIGKVKFLEGYVVKCLAALRRPCYNKYTFELSKPSKVKATDDIF